MTAPHGRYYLPSDEVREALAAHVPVVALESTIIAHGMPYPSNLETAHRLEAAIRENDAVPATIAVVDGAVRIGLSADQLERIASADIVEKVSTRDLGAVLAAGSLGATTVAATMLAAARTGIAVFATGGLGGVHRGVHESHDISADLTALATIPVAVVSAGVKSILDVGRTLEALETLGVPVIGYRTDEFPAFYLRSSGFPIPRRYDTAEEIAAMLEAHWGAGLNAGVVVANPVPAAHEADRQSIEAAIELGMQAAADEGIVGKEVTPFLLARVVQETGGESLGTNIALAVNNATLAAQIAGARARR